MFFSEGQSCPVCQKPFQKTDDIVVCPVCGAPHHRACYIATGHCHFEDTHGTPEQWSRDKAVNQAADAPKTEPQATTRRCPHCGFDNPEFAEFCGHCGRSITTENDAETKTPPPFRAAPFGVPFGESTYVPFRANVQNTGGVDPEAEIGDETAGDVARVVGRNQAYYMPTFQKFEQTGKSGKWNWAAFIFTPFWLLYRKCYLTGGLMLLFSLLQQLLVDYVEFVKLDLFSGGGSYADMMTRIQECMVDDSMNRYLSLISLFTIVSLVLHLFFGIFGNKIYEHSCLHRIRTAKQKFEDSYRDMLPVVGGVSASLALISYCVWYFLPLVFQTFLS